MPIDYAAARDILEESFAQVEANMLKGVTPSSEGQFARVCDRLFSSGTQAYREVLLGCILARIQDKHINIRLPYTDQGRDAYSGRSLDEKVVNPFLKYKRIPSSRGPYLSVFRRSVRFEPTTRNGLRDKTAYDAFLAAVGSVEQISDGEQLLAILRYLLYRFAKLREESTIPLSRVQRLSLEQYESLISGLLDTPSGGRFPVLLVVAALRAIKEYFNLGWDISWQGINVADNASGAAGDITVLSEGKIALAVEVTERPLDKSRVVTTFNTKIAPAGILDYLFFVKSDASADAKLQARRYFAQGHEINFVEIKNWITMSLATTGTKGRAVFNKALLDLLDTEDIPKAIKVRWNEHMAKITIGES